MHHSIAIDLAAVSNDRAAASRATFSAALGERSTSTGIDNSARTGGKSPPAIAAAERTLLDTRHPTRGANLLLANFPHLTQTRRRAMRAPRHRRLLQTRQHHPLFQDRHVKIVGNPLGRILKIQKCPPLQGNLGILRQQPIHLRFNLPHDSFPSRLTCCQFRHGFPHEAKTNPQNPTHYLLYTQRLAGSVTHPDAAGLNHLKNGALHICAPESFLLSPRSVGEASRLISFNVCFGASHGSCGNRSCSVYVFHRE